MRIFLGSVLYTFKGRDCPHFLRQEMMILKKVVSPAEAGVQRRSNYLIILDSRFHGNEQKEYFHTFYELIRNHSGMRLTKQHAGQPQSYLGIHHE